MGTFHVPYPKEPERRQAIFERVVAKLSRFGSCQGTPEEGAFQGSTPIGSFAGSYRSPAGDDVIEVQITKKPWLVSLSMIETEARKFMAQV